MTEAYLRMRGFKGYSSELEMGFKSGKIEMQPFFCHLDEMQEILIELNTDFSLKRNQKRKQFVTTASLLGVFLVFLKILEGVKRIYLDSAPIIYQIEGSEEFNQSTQLIFDMIDEGKLTAITSSITLSEVLVMPYRLGRIDLVENYRLTLKSNEHTEYVPILDEEAAITVAKLRATNEALKKFDAQHLAIAIQHHCDSFLTNDIRLKRVIDLPKELKIILLSELEAELNIKP